MSSNPQKLVEPGSSDGDLPVQRLILPSRTPRLIIRSDDPQFTNLVDQLIECLDDTANGTTVEDLAAEMGLSQDEIDLLFVVTKEENPTLYRKQKDLEKAYQEAVADPAFTMDRHHFISINFSVAKVAALTLAMAYFGVPAPPLSVQFRAAFNTAAARAAREKEFLAFLDAHRQSAAPGPKMKSVYVRFYGQTYTVRSSSCFLYGRQGAVRFDLEDPFSFMDAVGRLMGATRAVHVVLMRKAPGDQTATHGQTFHEIIKDMPTSDPFCFQAIRNVILKSRDGVDSDDVDVGWVPFVFLEGEEPPKDHWRPNDEPTGLVKCIRRGSPASALHPDSGDVAYLGFTVPFRKAQGKPPVARYQLYSNQYSPWFQIVARILTPGAGHVILEGRPGSLVAHCRLGLAVERFNAAQSGSGTELKPFSTHGGLGILGSHVSAIAAAGGNAGAVGGGTGFAFANSDDEDNDDIDDSDNEEDVNYKNDNPLRYVHFDTGNQEDWSVGVYLAGLTSDESDAAAAGISDINWAEAIDANSTQPSFRVSLAKCIDRVIEAGTTPNERKLLVGVDIWPEGYFWNNDREEANGPLRVAALPCDPDTLGSIDDYPDYPPSVVAIRPVYQIYTACVQSPGGPDGHFTFELDGPFDKFFESVEAVASLLFVRDATKKQDYGDYDEYKEFQTRRGRTADIVDPLRELNHIVIRQSNVKSNSYPNRPDFLVSRKTTQAEWLRVCSQIVGPEIWVSRASEADWYEKDLATPATWGYQASYENLLPLLDHEKRWEVLYKKRLQDQATKANAANAAKAVKAASAVTTGAAATAAPATVSATAPTTTTTTTGGYTRPLYECTFCSHEFYMSDTDTEMLRHMIRRHNVLRVPNPYEKAKPDVVITAAADENNNNNGAPTSAAADQTGLATPPPQQQRTPPKTGSNKKRIRSRTPSRLDPSYRPPKTKAKVTEDSSDQSSSGEASGSSDKNGTSTSKKRKAAGRRSTANDNPTYRPDENGDDELDHDLGSAKFVPDDFGDAAAKKRKRTTQSRTAHDPSYKPTKEDESDEEEEGVDDKDKDTNGDKKKAAPKKKVDDPSYHPGRNDTGDDLDDLDDALRQSAVPEYDRDPTDPAGKRLRVIREATGRAVRKLRQRKEKAAEKPAVAVTIAKAALGVKKKAATKAVTKGKGKERAVAASDSAASTPRRGRSRNATPAVDA